MPSSNTLLIDGSFEELAEEFAQYLDERGEKSGGNTGTHDALLPLLEQGKKDGVLALLVDGSIILSSVPEKEFVASYNLLIHLVRQAPEDLRNKCLSKICRHLSSPPASSPVHGPGLALSVLTTVFNILPYDDDTRYNVFQAILNVIRKTGPNAFESLKPQLSFVDSWFRAWETDEDDQRKLFLTISATAADAEEPEESYFYLLRALRTFEPDEADNEEARSLSLRALKSSLLQPNHFDFQDVTAIDAVQSLRKSHPIHFELLEIFTSQGLEEYNEFKAENQSWLSQEDLNTGVLDRKIRLLTLASLAAQAQNRSLPYDQISHQLQIPAKDVETWVIDVIRAGLVEGKLSQLNQTLLVHRSTYRVFGEKQWTEVQGRLDTWRTSLENVLAVVRQEREKVIREKERELKEIDHKLGAPNHGRRQIHDPEAVGD